MAYTHEGYTLHARTVVLKGGHEQTIYFFSKRTPVTGEPVAKLPEGYDVSTNKRTGLPYLRKKA